MQKKELRAVMMRYSYIIIVLAVLPLTGFAQQSGAAADNGGRRVLVADLETRRLLKDVAVSIGGRDTMRTAWDGSFLIPEAVDKAQNDSVRQGGSQYITFSHPLFFVRDMKVEEVGDTVLLMPRGRLLDEVVVTAKLPSVNNQVKNWGYDPVEMALQNSDPSGGANLLGLLGYLVQPLKKAAVEKKRRQREYRNQVLSSY